MTESATTILFTPSDGEPPRPATLEEVPALLAGPGWLWIDAVKPSRAAIAQLTTMLGIHEPDIDDMLVQTEFPKIEDREEYVFVIAHTTSLDESRLRTMEVDMVLSDGLLFTHRREESPGFDALRQIASQGNIAGPDDLMARALEVFGRRMLPLLTGMDELIYELEDRALAGDPNVPQQVQALRRDAIRLRRVVVPQRDALRSLAANQSFVKSRTARSRLVSGYDDAVRIADSLDTARSLLGAVLDTYRATVAERMNEVMKVLTVFAAIVLPLGLLAGIYGMNFVDMPGLEDSRGFAVAIGVMAIIAIGLWAYFVRRQFIGGPRLPRVDRVVGKGLAGFVHLTLAPVRLLEKALDLDEE